MTPPALTATIQGHEAYLPKLTVELLGGRTGYYQRSNAAPDGCFQAAVATWLQIPLEEITFESVGNLAAWAAERNLLLMPHAKPPMDGRLWLAITPPMLDEGDPDLADFRIEFGTDPRHAFVGVYDQVYFDPGAGWVFPPGVERIAPNEAEHILTLEPIG